MTQRHATTVRFDGDLWHRLGVIADRLGVARAELIRDATREHITRLEDRERIDRLDDRIEHVEEAVDNVRQTIARLARHMREIASLGRVPAAPAARRTTNVPDRL